MRWMRPEPGIRSAWKLILPALVVFLLAAAYFLYRRYPVGAARSMQVRAWLHDPASHPGWSIQAGTRCNQAPFLFPTDGFVGYLWDDVFQLGHRHQGIDIFGGTEVDVTPVIAAYSGYLTRQSDWKATVIVRIPEDPLQPGRQIWTYYTHMADAEGNSFIDAAFPPGVSEISVQAGTLLGYQGNYSGTSGNPVGVHLHFSIVKDDGLGHYTNELNISNTLDPSAYLGLSLNARSGQGQAKVCTQPGV
jgi:hypothetical protein